MGPSVYVEFAGLPGSGKTALIEKLVSSLSEQGIPSTVRENLVAKPKAGRYASGLSIALSDPYLLMLVIRYCLFSRPFRWFNFYLTFSTLKFVLSLRQMEGSRASVLIFEGIVHWLSAVSPERIEDDEDGARALFARLYRERAPVLFISVDTSIKVSVDRFLNRPTIHPRFGRMDAEEVLSFNRARSAKEARLLRIVQEQTGSKILSISGVGNSDAGIRAIVDTLLPMIKDSESARRRLLLAMDRASREAHEYTTQYIGPGAWYRLKRLLKYPLAYGTFAIARTFGIRGTRSAKLFFGSKLHVPLNDGDAFLLARFGTLVGGEYKLIRYLIQTLKNDDVFYDIGANYGFYSALAQKLITRGEIHAFEPIPDIFRYTARSFYGCKQCTLNQIALSNKDGSIPMYSAFAFGTSAVSTIDSSVRELDTVTAWESIAVQSMTLDTYTADHTPPTIIKLDVEGAERFVLEGGKESIARHRPVIAMEVWGGEKGNTFSREAVAILLNAGYHAYGIDDVGGLIPYEASYFSELSRTPDGSENFIFRPL